METKRKGRSNARVLTECSIMIALSAVLSIVKLFEMPYGGSITLASMMPIALIAYRYGAKCGIATAAAASLVQMLLGVKNFSYFTTWQSLIAIALLDYIVAFTVFGLAGIFRKKIKKQSTALICGVALASLIRYVCHVVSGATVWAGLSIPTEAALIYSLSYNATYMIPETIILALAGTYVFSVLDFSHKTPRRIKRGNTDTISSCCALLAGIVFLAAMIADVALVFKVLQNAKTGELDLSGIVNANTPALITVSAIGILIPVILIGIIKIRQRKA